MSFKACAVASDAKTGGDFLAKLLLQRLAECSDETGRAPLDVEDLTSYAEAEAGAVQAAVDRLASRGIVILHQGLFNADEVTVEIVGGAS